MLLASKHVNEARQPNHLDQVTTSSIGPNELVRASSTGEHPPPGPARPGWPGSGPPALRTLPRPPASSPGSGEPACPPRSPPGHPAPHTPVLDLRVRLLSQVREKLLRVLQPAVAGQQVRAPGAIRCAERPNTPGGC